MKESIVRITTADTGKTYELPGKGNPQLWEAKISLKRVEPSGYIRSSDFGVSREIHLEQETLENCGLVGKKPDPTPPHLKPDDTVEDLIIRLLELLGYYPCPDE